MPSALRVTVARTMLALSTRYWKTRRRDLARQLIWFVSDSRSEELVALRVRDRIALKRVLTIHFKASRLDAQT